MASMRLSTPVSRVVPLRYLAHTSVLPRAVAAYMTTAAGPQDLCVIQDDIDYIVVQKERQDAGATQLPLPGASKNIQVSVTHDVNGLAARCLVRDKYANGK